MKNLIKTEFKPIKGYPEYYAGSNGKIYRCVSNKMRPLVMYIYGYSKYPEVYLCTNNERKKFFVHRLVIKSFGITKFSNYKIKFADGNPLNNSPGNIEVKKLAYKIRRVRCEGEEETLRVSVSEMMYMIKRDKRLCGSDEEWKYIKKSLARRDYKFKHNWLKIYMRSRV
ncbi:MAG TPA: hypothetical protein PLG90_12650 [Ignavibacteria bacterium]|nr:hypothetical protein [Ignavibacteria bacterium]